MRDPQKDKMLKNATFILQLLTNKSIRDTVTMGSIREQCMAIMTEDDIEKVAAFLESGEAMEYLRTIADQ